ncbi:MAG: hypothetical protein J0L93_08080 [Deltaproteobacteria bacterium]|nr:hypothetical protein [Deltaproteobacteria bacterium]
MLGLIGRESDLKLRIVSKPRVSHQHDRVLLRVSDGKDLLGLCRLSFSSSQPLEDDEHLYDINRFETMYPRGVVLLEHFFSESHPDEKQILEDLVKTAFKLALKRNSSVMIIGCRSEVHLQILLQLGFRLYIRNSYESEQGFRTPLVLFIQDEAHLRLYDSPLLDILMESRLELSKIESRPSPDDLSGTNLSLMSASIG